jgi:tripartite-type tricarboxylate transporter receptor subunit TctC
MRAGIIVNVIRADRHRLEAIIRDRGAPQKHVWRAQVQGKTPPAIIQRLHAEIAKSLQSGDVQQTLIAQGIEPVGNTPQEFAAFLDNERRRSAELIKILGVRLN